MAVPTMSSGEPRRPAGVRPVAQLSSSSYLPELAVEIGQDEAWGDGIDLYVVWPPLHRQTLGKLSQGALRARVYGHLGQANGGGERGDVDDLAALACHHPPTHLPAEEVGSLYIHVHHLVELALVDLLDGAAHVGAGDIEEEPDAADRPPI